MILLQTLWATFAGLGFRSSSKEPQRKALCEAVASCPCYAALREEVSSVWEGKNWYRCLGHLRNYLQINTRTLSDCEPGKNREKMPHGTDMTEESNASHQGEEIQIKHSHTLKHPQQISSAKQRLSRTPKSRENNPARVKTPRVRAMLGEDKMTHYPVLLQLVACEAICFRSS